MKSYHHQNIIEILNQYIIIPKDLGNDNSYIPLFKIMQHNGLFKENIRTNNNLELLVSTKENIPIFLDFIFQEQLNDEQLMIFSSAKEDGILCNTSELENCFQHKWQEQFGCISDFRIDDFYFFSLTKQMLYVYEHWGNTYFYDLNKKNNTPKFLYYDYPIKVEPKNVIIDKKYKLRNKYSLKISKLSSKAEQSIFDLGYDIKTDLSNETLKLSKVDIHQLEILLKRSG